MQKNKGFKKLLIISLCWFNFYTYSFAQNTSPPPTTNTVIQTIKPPQIKAGSYILVDFQSGVELIAENPAQQIEPASITKLMTAYLLYEALATGNISLKDEVLVSEKAWKMEGSRMFMELGKKIPFEKMLKGLIIQSGNDAAVALAEHIAGSESSFVDKMNTKAKQLGMNNTYFVNSTGWPDKNHYTTARDIVTLTKALITRYPEHYKMYAEKHFSYNGIKQYNRNKLLWKDKTVDGVKTGHTESAGFCLVASAKRDNMRLISVLLGAKDDDERSMYTQQLLEHGFRFYETHKLYNSGAVLEEARIWKGNKDIVPLGVNHDIWISIQKGHYKNLKGSMQINKGIDAPINRGDILGKIILKDGNNILRTAPLVAMDSVAEGGWAGNIIDTVHKFFAE